MRQMSSMKSFPSENPRTHMLAHRGDKTYVVVEIALRALYLQQTVREENHLIMRHKPRLAHRIGRLLENAKHRPRFFAL